MSAFPLALVHLESARLGLHESADIFSAILPLPSSPPHLWGCLPLRAARESMCRVRCVYLCLTVVLIIFSLIPFSCFLCVWRPHRPTIVGSAAGGSHRCFLRLRLLASPRPNGYSNHGLSRDEEILYILYLYIYVYTVVNTVVSHCVLC